MPSKADIEQDNSNAYWIEDMLASLGLFVTKGGIYSSQPKDFCNAVPAVGKMFNHVISSAGHSMREVEEKANALRKIEGVAMFRTPDCDEGYTLVSCRPLSMHLKKALFFTKDGLFSPPPRPGRHMKRDVCRRITLMTPILQIRKLVIDVDGNGTVAAPAYMMKVIDVDDRWGELVAGDLFGEMSLAGAGFNIAVGISTCMTTDWSVSIKFHPDEPGLLFFTDPTGIRDFFRFRDVPEGKARRAALANWVTDHWRQHRDRPEDEIYVRTHLRGAKNFIWRGLIVAITIPDTDLIKAEAVKEQRKRLPVEEAIRRRRRAKP